MSNTARRIVDRIVDDLTDRKALRQAGSVLKWASSDPELAAYQTRYRDKPQEQAA